MFTSDISNTYSGFVAAFTSVVVPSPSPQPLACSAAGSVVQSGSGGVDFSNGYTNNLFCNFTFTATVGYVAQVTFVGSFRTESGYDFVRLYVPGSDSPVTSLSGSPNPLPGVSHGCADPRMRGYKDTMNHGYIDPWDPWIHGYARVDEFRYRSGHGVCTDVQAGV